MQLDELDTPVAVVDLDRLELNIAAAQEYFDHHHIANRPHVKTHKIPAIAHMQVAAGAVGIACQKIGEAEVMVEAGLQDIFIPYNILGASKLERLTALATRAAVSVTADSEVVARGLSSAFARTGQELVVLVECDTGGGRCGVPTPERAASLARVIAGLPGLQFGGLMTYPNSPRLDPFMEETARLLEAHGLSVGRVSGGGTAGMWQAHTHRTLTEHRAGMYIYGDRATMAAGAVSEETRAFGVLSTVVSRPTATRGILDAGSKVLSSDLVGMEGYGAILEYPEAVVYQLSEEHGTVDFSGCARGPEIGERVTVIPNHCCPVTNLLDEVVGVRGSTVEIRWPIAARGTVR